MSTLRSHLLAITGNRPPDIEQLWALAKFQLNPQQKAAILHEEGPLYLTAGPGSGKTRVLLWRTLHLIVHRGVPPEEIFLSTFTEKAALTTAFKDHPIDYTVNIQPATQVVTNGDGTLAGALVKRKPGPLPPPKGGKSIAIGGTLTKLEKFTKFFQSVLKPITSQKPSKLTIDVTVRAEFDEDPGSGLDAALDDGLDGGGLPGVNRLGGGIAGEHRTMNSY